MLTVALQQPEFDVVLRGGTVVDGSGAPRFRADVGISGDRITRVARDGIARGSGRVELDATGLIVAPGFVDHHAHISTNIHERPLAENFLFQGITTIMASLHSGDVPWPLRAYMDSLRSAPNIGFFAGHTWARVKVLGLANRAPTAPELERMKALVDTAMRDGALGLSTGLLYVPANYAKTEEVIELAKVAARYRGLYVTHMRDEARGLLDVGARSHPHRPGGGTAGADQPPQGRRGGAVRLERPDPGADRFRACAGSRREPRSLSLRGGKHRVERALPAVGAGRRPRFAARAGE